MGRVNIALKFNELVREGKIGPVMLGRGHHDVSGTDSPFRETSNIKDGNVLCRYGCNATPEMLLGGCFFDLHCITVVVSEWQINQWRFWTCTRWFRTSGRRDHQVSDCLGYDGRGGT